MFSAYQIEFFYIMNIHYFYDKIVDIRKRNSGEYSLLGIFFFEINLNFISSSNCCIYFLSQCLFGSKLFILYYFALCPSPQNGKS